MNRVYDSHLSIAIRVNYYCTVLSYSTSSTTSEPEAKRRRDTCTLSTEMVRNRKVTKLGNRYSHTGCSGHFMHFQFPEMLTFLYNV